MKKVFCGKMKSDLIHTFNKRADDLECQVVRSCSVSSYEILKVNDSHEQNPDAERIGENFRGTIHKEDDQNVGCRQTILNLKGIIRV